MPLAAIEGRKHSRVVVIEIEAREHIEQVLVHCSLLVALLGRLDQLVDILDQLVSEFSHYFIIIVFAHHRGCHKRFSLESLLSFIEGVDRQRFSWSWLDKSVIRHNGVVEARHYFTEEQTSIQDHL